MNDKTLFFCYHPYNLNICSTFFQSCVNGLKIESNPFRFVFNDPIFNEQLFGIAYMGSKMKLTYRQGPVVNMIIIIEEMFVTYTLQSR